ncbi:snoRNA binding domain protein [Nitzschia inconspicua]|uniref:SnoRNA binding domain protein n=1 Tax=Nitzschia inconspicua TaxID=303405 RepID=A0A9K3P870_9STRA|nr:snoRNA binding domain protein [Nitzschia inconspicua]
MEATTTLADALLDDLDDLMDSDNEQEEVDNNHNHNQKQQQQQQQQQQHQQQEQQQSSHIHDPSLATATTTIAQEDRGGSYSINDTTKILRRPFLENPSLQEHLIKVRNHRKVDEHISHHNNNPTTTTKHHKDHEEENHQLVVQSNRYIASLVEELGRAHAELAKAYKPKFPELEELIPNYVQYKNAVRIIGNEMDLTKVNDELNDILGSNQIITISVAGSTTSGRPLDPNEMDAVHAAAEYMDQILDVQKVGSIRRRVHGISLS